MATISAPPIIIAPCLNVAQYSFSAEKSMATAEDNSSPESSFQFFMRHKVYIDFICSWQLRIQDNLRWQYNAQGF